MVPSNDSELHRAVTMHEAATASAIALRITDLTVTAKDSSGSSTPIVMESSLDVAQGEIVALVGESGSGKSTVLRAVTRLLDSNLVIESGSIRVGDTSVLDLRPSELARLRGRVVGMVFQDPTASLNPVRSIGFQLSETRRRHGLDAGASLRSWELRTLEDLGLDDAENALDAYPHSFSGGMLQRICIGMAFSGNPAVVLADEPTTALDVSLQGRLLRLMLRYQQEHNTAILMVSHDVAVVRAVASRVVVMYGGRVMESGPVEDVFSSPRHPYTQALVASVPQMTRSHRREPLPTVPEADAGDIVGAQACPFAGRCPRVLDRCWVSFPEPSVVAESGRAFWCFNPVPDGNP